MRKRIILAIIISILFVIATISVIFASRSFVNLNGMDILRIEMVYKNQEIVFDGTNSIVISDAENVVVTDINEINTILNILSTYTYRFALIDFEEFKKSARMDDKDSETMIRLYIYTKNDDVVEINLLYHSLYMQLSNSFYEESKYYKVVSGNADENFEKLLNIYYQQ